MAATVIRLLCGHATRMKWEREQLHKANKLHEEFLLERCTHHLMQLGHARWCMHISSEVGRQTAAFAQNLMTVAPFAMRWLMVTRRSKARKSSGKCGEVPPSIQNLLDQENIGSFENRSLVESQRCQAWAKYHSQTRGTAQEYSVLHARDTSQRRQVCHMKSMAVCTVQWPS